MLGSQPLNWTLANEGQMTSDNYEEASVDPNVYLIDDDDDIREFVKTILSSLNIPVIAYSSAKAFLKDYSQEMHGCILSDIMMPEMNGLELQIQLKKENIVLPIIFMSAHGDIKMAKTTLKNGAVDFLEKPLDVTELVNVVKNGLNTAEEVTSYQYQADLLEKRLSTLTLREKQILDFLMSGYSNAQISLQQGISIRTVETHRNRVLKKTGTSSLQDLTRLLHK